MPSVPPRPPVPGPGYTGTGTGTGSGPGPGTGTVPPGGTVGASTSSPQPAFRCVLREKWPRIAFDLRHGLSHNTSAAYTAYATQHATQHVVITHKQKAYPGYITMHDHKTPQQQSGTVILSHSRQTKLRISRYMRVKERADRQRKDERCRSYVSLPQAACLSCCRGVSFWGGGACAGCLGTPRAT